MPSHQNNSILCPNCHRIISKDESRCPYCAVIRPTAWWRNNLLYGFLRQPDLFIKGLIFTNVVMFGISILLNPQNTRMGINPLTLLSPDYRSLILLGGSGTIPIDHLNRWWSLISANYLHGGLLHILFNMLVLYQIAPIVIREFGLYRMFIIYTLSGAAGFLVSYYAGIPLTIGASAALCGLMGALMFYGKSRGGVYGHVIYRQIGGWVLGIFLFGLLVPGINNWAHGGGLLGGILCAWMLGYSEKRPPGSIHEIFGLLTLLGTLGVLIYAAGSAVYYLM